MSRPKTIHTFKNIHTGEVWEYLRREIVNGNITVHILLRPEDKTEHRWDEKLFKKHWERFTDASN